jgi:hypothetical protein
VADAGLVHGVDGESAGLGGGLGEEGRLELHGGKVPIALGPDAPPGKQNFGDCIAVGGHGTGPPIKKKASPRRRLALKLV